MICPIFDNTFLFVSKPFDSLENLSIPILGTPPALPDNISNKKRNTRVTSKTENEKEKYHEKLKLENNHNL